MYPRQTFKYQKQLSCKFCTKDVPHADTPHGQTYMAQNIPAGMRAGKSHWGAITRQLPRAAAKQLKI